jgi:hypothetical protein
VLSWVNIENAHIHCANTVTAGHDDGTAQEQAATHEASDQNNKQHHSLTDLDHRTTPLHCCRHHAPAGAEVLIKTSQLAASAAVAAC